MSAFNRVPAAAGGGGLGTDMDVEGDASSSNAAANANNDRLRLAQPKPAYAPHEYPQGTYRSSGSFDLSAELSSPPRPGHSPGIVRRAGSLGSSGEFGYSNPLASLGMGVDGRVPNMSSGSGSKVPGAGAPQASMSRSSMVYSDRFIPSRNASDLESAFDHLGGSHDHGCGMENAGDTSNFSSHSQSSYGYSGGEGQGRRDSKALMNDLLRSELLGVEGPTAGAGARASTGGGMHRTGPVGADALRSSSDSIRSTGSGGGSSLGGSLDMRGSGSFTGQSVLKFRSDRRRGSGDSASLGSSGNNSMSSSDGTHNNNSSSSSNNNNSNSLLGGGGQNNLNVGNVGSHSMPSSHQMSPSSLGLGSSQRKPQRKISKTPYKVLDAPSLQDDYYLNLLDWSSSNVLSVALGSIVYLWGASDSKVTKLCDTGADNLVTSICWSPGGSHLAVGTNSGKVQLWDVQQQALVKESHTHASRVGTMAWSSELLATGSRDRTIKCHDGRIRGSGAPDDPMSIGSRNNYSNRHSNGTSSEPSVVHEFTSHKQEVCGLKWSPDERMLASGGNDNKLYVWSTRQSDPTNPMCRFSDHIAAVKAVAWSPHTTGILASGGGTADRNIRFWNSHTGVPLHRIDTGSQVCNLMWSKNVNEIVSTHGYSLNQIIVWKYPTMQKVTTLTGHGLRVLYLAMSPDGQAVVTGAGDETLRFWNLFPGPRSAGGMRGSGMLFPGGGIR